MADLPPRVLIQLDSDQHPSVFDSIVAFDSGVEQLLPFGNVEPIDVRDLVYGAMFTRGGSNLRRTAVFVGGSNVQTGEQMMQSVQDAFFGPVRVSVMLDASGANTTAAAAICAMQRHMDLSGKTVAVIAATGAVGRRVTWLAAKLGATVIVLSRSLERATDLCQQLHSRAPNIRLQPAASDGPGDQALIDFLADCDGVIATGASGVELLRSGDLATLPNLQVAIDLNAVPPAGIHGIEPHDAGRNAGPAVIYGAIGVGNLKMKIHKRCLQMLFEANDRVLDIDEIYAIGRETLAAVS
jgi:hypothetical protein